MQVFRVYLLIDADGLVRYVGKTGYPLGVRLNAHKSAKSKIGEWVRSEFATGMPVSIHSWQSFATDILARRGEKEAVKQFASPKLLNVKLRIES